MSKKTSRFLGLVLSLSMICSMITIPVNAQSGNTLAWEAVWSQDFNNVSDITVLSNSAVLSEAGYATTLEIDPETYGSDSNTNTRHAYLSTRSAGDYALTLTHTSMSKAKLPIDIKIPGTETNKYKISYDWQTSCADIGDNSGRSDFRLGGTKDWFRIGAVDTELYFSGGYGQNNKYKFAANTWYKVDVILDLGKGDASFTIYNENGTVFASGASNSGGWKPMDDLTYFAFYGVYGGQKVDNIVISKEAVNYSTGNVYYNQDFEGITSDFDTWKEANGYTVTNTQPFQIWGGSFAADEENNYIRSNSMDMYPLAVTPRTGKYKLSFDLKPNAEIFSYGSNWESVVMQFSLGSSNADSWHDMKIGTSKGAKQTGEVPIDRLWLFGKEMTIDPTKWINLSIVYDCVSGVIDAKATQGATSVTGSAKFTNTTTSLTGNPKLIFDGSKPDGTNRYEGVYLDNFVIEDIAYYEQDFEGITSDFTTWVKENGTTVTYEQPFQIWGGNFASDSESNYMLSNSMAVYPLAVTPKTGIYELSFDLKPNAPTFSYGSNWESIVMQFNLGSSNSDSWHDMKIGTSKGAKQTGEVPIDRLWLFGNEMTIDPTKWINVSIVYDCGLGVISAKASQGETFVTGSANFTNTTSSLTGSPAMSFEGLTPDGTNRYEGVYLDNFVIDSYKPKVDSATGAYYKQEFEGITSGFDAWKTTNGYTVTVTQPMQIWGGSFAADEGNNYMRSNSMDIYPLAVTPRTGIYELSFDLKPNAETFLYGSNWESIVMQFDLGSSNSDSYHDMKIGTSMGAKQTGEVPVDRLWLFGKEMTIDPTKWINVSVVYDCENGTIEAKATQGNTSVTGSANFINTTTSVKGSPKLTFSGQTPNGTNRYEGVYLDNITISEYKNLNLLWKDNFQSEDSENGYKPPYISGNYYLNGWGQSGEFDYVLRTDYNGGNATIKFADVFDSGVESNLTSGKYKLSYDWRFITHTYDTRRAIIRIGNDTSYTAIGEYYEYPTDFGVNTTTPLQITDCQALADNNYMLTNKRWYHAEMIVDMDNHRVNYTLYYGDDVVYSLENRTISNLDSWNQIVLTSVVANMDIDNIVLERMESTPFKNVEGCYEKTFDVSATYVEFEADVYYDGTATERAVYATADNKLVDIFNIGDGYVILGNEVKYIDTPRGWYNIKGSVDYIDKEVSVKITTPDDNKEENANYTSLNFTTSIDKFYVNFPTGSYRNVSVEESIKAYVSKVSKDGVKVYDISQLEANDTVKVNLVYKNTSAEESDCVVLAAYYDINEKLIRAEIVKNVEAYTVGDMTGVKKLSFFVWESIDNIKPMGEKYEIDETPDSLKILSIGNSFSDDTQAYLYQIAESYGFEEIVIANLYIGGCILQKHSQNADNNTPAYAYRKNISGEFVTSTEETMLNGILDEDWDVITMQTDSSLAGIASTFHPYLGNLKNYVNTHKTNPDATLAWHFTWAYPQNSTHAGFANYNKDQMTMYNAIKSVVQSEIVGDTDFSIIIPTGTAVQNARTSFVGDNLTRDEHHLGIPFGRYVGGLTYFAALTGCSIDDIEYAPEGVTAAQISVAKESVNNAMTTPFEVTNSVYTVEQ